MGTNNVPTGHRGPRNARPGYDFLTAIKTFDREEFGVLCRRLECLLMARQVDIAVGALRNFAANKGFSKTTLASHVVDAFPMRVANILEQAGYANIYAVAGATDEQLLKLPNISAKIVGDIRSRIEGIRQHLVNDVNSCSKNDIGPEWEIDNELLVDLVAASAPVVTVVEDAMQQGLKGTDGVLAKIESLFEDPDATAAALQARLDSLHAEEEKIRRAMNLLGVRPKARRNPFHLSEENIESAEEAISKNLAVGQRKTITELANDTGIQFAKLGRIVSMSKKFEKSGRYVVRVRQS